MSLPCAICIRQDAGCNGLEARAPLWQLDHAGSDARGAEGEPFGFPNSVPYPHAPMGCHVVLNSSVSRTA